MLAFRDLPEFSSWRDRIELPSEDFIPGLQHHEMRAPLIPCWLSCRGSDFKMKTSRDGGWKEQEQVCVQASRDLAADGAGR